MTALRPILFTLLLGPVLAGPLAAAEAVVTDALREITGIEQQAAQLAPGDKATANRYLQRLKSVSLKLKSARDQSAPDWAEAARRFNELQSRIVATANAAPGAAPPAAPGPSGGAGAGAPAAERAALQQLEADVDRAAADLATVRVDSLGDAALVQTWRSRLAALRERAAALPPGPELTPVAGQIEDLGRTLEGGIATREGRVRGADLGSRLQTLIDRYQPGQLPPALAEPLEPEAVRAWAQGMTEWLGKAVERDLAEVETIAKDPAADPQKVSSARFWIGVEGRRRLRELIDQGSALVEGQVGTGQSFADWVMALDPGNEDHVANRLLGQGRFDENMQRLQDGLKAVAVAGALDQGLGRTGGPDRATQRAGLERAVEHLRSAAEHALASVRMPPARSSDPALLEAAAAALREPKYGVPGWERMVISYDLNRKEKLEGTIYPGTVNATVTVYKYVWDEMGVTTAEKEGGQVYLWFNRLKRYLQGDTRTPTDTWILSERFRSTRILPENIGK